MATIGYLSRTENGTLIGKIETLAFTNVIGLRPFNSDNPRAPKFELMARTSARTWVPIGGMFEQTMRASGESFYQGRIDDPSMGRPMDIALFPNDEGGFNISWTRRRTRQDMPAGPDAGDMPSRDDLGESTAQDEAHLAQVTGAEPKAKTRKGSEEPAA